jgi:hypothetical protein
MYILSDSQTAPKGRVSVGLPAFPDDTVRVGGKRAMTRPRRAPGIWYPIHEQETTSDISDGTVGRAGPSLGDGELLPVDS